MYPLFSLLGGGRVRERRTLSFLLLLSLCFIVGQLRIGKEIYSAMYYQANKEFIMHSMNPPRILLLADDNTVGTADNRTNNNNDQQQLLLPTYNNDSDEELSMSTEDVGQFQNRSSMVIKLKNSNSNSSKHTGSDKPTGKNTIERKTIMGTTTSQSIIIINSTSTASNNMVDEKKKTISNENKIISNTSNNFNDTVETISILIEEGADVNSSITNESLIQNQNVSANSTLILRRWRTTNLSATVMSDGNLNIEFFSNNNNNVANNGENKSNKTRTTKELGMSACLFNLEDTIRLAEWIPYHYTMLPLTSLVVALDPKTSDRGIDRTLHLIDLWKDRIDISLWPEYILPNDKRYRKKQLYERQRQVYFANRCMMYHKQFADRSWTLLTDNDEYLLYNYAHNDTEQINYDHPGLPKKKVKRQIDSNRKNYMPWRYQNKLPSKLNQTIFDFIQQHSAVLHLPKCIRIPGIFYGGGEQEIRVNGSTSMPSSFSSSSSWNKRHFFHNIIDDPNLLSTYRFVHHMKRNSDFSKVMIDVNRTDIENLKWSEKNNARTIHNPNGVCGFNGQVDSGADYYSSLFRLNHYVGSMESYFERGSNDFRKRNKWTYWNKMYKYINVTANPDWYDYDIYPWMDLFLTKVGKNETIAKQLLQPLMSFTNIEATTASVV